MSWLDRLVGVVSRRRLPWWLVFVVLFIMIAAVFNIVKWVDGTNTFPVLDWSTFDAFYASAAFAAYGLLTTAAGRALDRIVPALDDSDERIAASRRRLTRMPQWQMAIAFVLGGAFGVIIDFTDPVATEQIFTSIASAVATAILGDILGYGLTIVVIWQLLRTVAEVASLHRRITAIDIEHTGPAHAFAPVTAGAGTYLLAMATYSALTDPATFASGALLVLFFVITFIATLVFVLPLLGMRTRLVEAKQSELDSIATRTRVALDDLEGALDGKKYDNVGGIRSAVDALTERRDRVRRHSTWPWDTRVASGFLGALILPLLSWGITVAAERFFGL